MMEPVEVTCWEYDEGDGDPQQFPPNRPVVGPDLAKIRVMIDAQVAARGGLNALLARIADKNL